MNPCWRESPATEFRRGEEREPPFVGLAQGSALCLSIPVAVLCVVAWH